MRTLYQSVTNILCFYDILAADHTREKAYDFKKWSWSLGGLMAGSIGVLSIPKLSGKESTAAAQTPLLLAIVFCCSACVLVTYLWTAGSLLRLKTRRSPPWILLACIVLLSGLSLFLGFMPYVTRVGSDGEQEILLSRVLPAGVAMLLLVFIMVIVLVNEGHKRCYVDDVESQLANTIVDDSQQATLSPKLQVARVATPFSYNTSATADFSGRPSADLCQCACCEATKEQLTHVKRVFLPNQSSAATRHKEINDERSTQGDRDQLRLHDRHTETVLIRSDSHPNRLGSPGFGHEAGPQTLPHETERSGKAANEGQVKGPGNDIQHDVDQICSRIEQNNNQPTEEEAKLYMKSEEGNTIAASEEGGESGLGG
ncbi:hypothetical protein FRC07_002578 [Ceratobasidium sp. 392]|nr:hypothetical protein FRC07_002578 [Ceratobasidium sp. 392]